MKYAAFVILAILAIGLGVWLFHDAPQVSTAAADAARKEIARQELAGKYNLAEAYFYGRGVPINKKEALRLWEEAARGGLTEGWVQVANMYSFGIEVEPDPTRVVEAWRHLAEAHYPGSESDYTWALWNGWGTERDRAAAVRIWQRYPEDIHFSYWLGEAYMQGETVPRDPKRAIELWKTTCESTIHAPDCWYAMCRAYADGTGVERDAATASRWCRRIAHDGLYQPTPPSPLPRKPSQNPSVIRVEESYRQAADAREVLVRLKPALLAGAERGEAASQFEYGATLRDNAEKRKWFERAAAQGHAEAVKTVAIIKRNESAAGPVIRQ